MDSFVLVLFALSGLTGLVYEVLWRRMLSIALGGSIYATAAVLSSFMAGLFLGSIVVGRRTDRWRNLLRIYGLFELLIALFAVFFPFACEALVSLQRSFYPSLGDDSLAVAGAKFTASFLVLLFPTFLMGGTFPLLAKFYLRSPLFVGKGVGRLYSVNTAGAVIGTILAGFFLIKSLGVRGTNLVAVMLNGTVGATAIALSAAGASRRAPSVFEPEHPAENLRPSIRRVALLLFGISGFTALCYEVLWTRVLVFVVGNTTYSFTVMLSSFLAGLALGSYAFARFFARGKDFLLKAALIEVLIGICAIVGMVLTQSFCPLFRWLKGHFSTWGYGPYTLTRYAIAWIGVLPPAVLFGMSFPAIVGACTGRQEKIGRDVGCAYASNTVGAVFGSVAAVFVLIPIFGVAGAMLLTAVGNLTVGLVFLALSPVLSSKTKLLSAIGTVAVFGCLLLALAPRVEVGRSSEGAEGKRGSLLFYREGAAGTVAVFLDVEQGLKMMQIDGQPQVPTDLDALQAFRLLGHLPFFIHPNPREVLVTAFGGGITTGAILTHPVDRVDAVEICPSVFEAAKLFQNENNSVLSDIRLRLIVGDANNYVKVTNRTYDVIASDATHPGASESWALYTHEFYAACRKLLRKGGVMCQWVPLHALPTSDLKIILRTFQSVFPHASLWFARGYTVMLGTLAPLVLNAERINGVLRSDERRFDLLREVHLESVPAIVKNLIAVEEDLRAFAGDGPLATEDKSPLAFAESRAVGRELIPVNIGALAKAIGREFPKVVGTMGRENEAIRAALAIRLPYLEAARCWHERSPVEGLEHLQQAFASGWEDADLSWYLRWMTILAFQRYRRAGDVEKAIADFRRWAVIFPRSPWTKVALGHFLIDKARLGANADALTEGLAELNRAGELAGGDPIVLQDVSQALLSAGKDEQAIPFLEQYIEKFPDDPQNRTNLIGAYLRTESFAKAIPLLENLAAAYPEDPTSWSTLAGAYLAVERYAEAKAAILKAIQFDPYNPTFKATLERLDELVTPPQPPQEKGGSK